MQLRDEVTLVFVDVPVICCVNLKVAYVASLLCMYKPIQTHACRLACNRAHVGSDCDWAPYKGVVRVVLSSRYFYFVNELLMSD